MAEEKTQDDDLFATYTIEDNNRSIRIMNYQEKKLRDIAIERGVYKKGRKNYSQSSKKWEKGLEKFILDSFENDAKKNLIHKRLIVNSEKSGRKGYVTREIFRLMKDLNLYYDFKKWHNWNDGYYPKTISNRETFKNFLINNPIMKSILQPGRVVVAQRLVI